MGIRIWTMCVALLLCWQTALNAQELDASVKVSIVKLATVDPNMFKNMESEIEDFFNNQKWTDDTFESEERIECAFQFNIVEELDETTFQADIALQSTRPVYGSDYKTAIFTHVDRGIIFNYEPFRQLEDSRDAFRDNLSSVLTFYAYLILGYDYDTFSPMGGDGFFRAAQQIINSIPPNIASSDRGWAALGTSNRYWILENMLSPRVRPYRLALYQYHLQSLDAMHEDPETARQAMLEALTNVESVHASYPNSMAVRIFTNTKSDEILDIFKNGDRSQKTRVFQIMRKIDPANSPKYNILRS